MVSIQLDSDNAHTVKELTELVRLVLEFVGDEVPAESLEYSTSDVYWTLRSLLNYVNRQIPGEVVLKRLKKGSWGLEYTDEKAAKRKADERHRRELKRTADYIQELTDRRPSWG
ncbi:MAG: hypothetical protein O7E52_21565 [Candidatus Poribacteria bacterium]|nr:hypothetical protein [Candidatus Poribacteria bacterium]